MSANAEDIAKWTRRIRARYPVESAVFTTEQIEKTLYGWLNLVPALEITDHEDQVRCLALSVLVTPEQRRSQLVRGVLTRIMSNTEWPAYRRLDFIYKHLVGRSLSANEEDFGPDFVPFAGPIDDV